MTFVDAHCHALFAGRELQGAILHGCTTSEQIIAAIRAQIEAHPEQTWFDLSAIPADLDLDRYTLDQASTELPIVVHSDDHHSICVNSKALEIAGYTNHAPDVAGGRFDLANGRPTGWIHEYMAMQLIYAHQPKPTLEQDLAALLQAQDILLKNQVTAMTEAWIDPGMPEVYFEFATRNLLAVKTDLAVRITPEYPSLDFALQTRNQARVLNHPLLTANTVKLFLDGVHSSNTAWLKSHPEAKSVWMPTELVKTAQQAVDEGFNLHFHACGDAAVRQAIDIVAETGAKNAVIAHADVIDPADLPALKQLDITINSTPVWAENAPTNHFDYRAILDHGIKLTFGSDWPVSLPNPIANIEAAIKYRNLTEAEALRASQANSIDSK